MLKQRTKKKEKKERKTRDTVLTKPLQDWGNEKLQRAQKSIDESPYDLEAWSILIREAQNRPITEVRPVFERLVNVFPSAGRYWKIYIEQEVMKKHFLEKRTLFPSRNLSLVVSRRFLTYVFVSR